jgi:hypothetical protein
LANDATNCKKIEEKHGAYPSIRAYLLQSHGVMGGDVKSGVIMINDKFEHQESGVIRPA